MKDSLLEVEENREMPFFTPYVCRRRIFAVTLHIRFKFCSRRSEDVENGGSVLVTIVKTTHIKIRKKTRVSSQTHLHTKLHIKGKIIVFTFKTCE